MTRTGTYLPSNWSVSLPTGLSARCWMGDSILHYSQVTHPDRTLGTLARVALGRWSRAKVRISGPPPLADLSRPSAVASRVGGLRATDLSPVAGEPDLERLGMNRSVPDTDVENMLEQDDTNAWRRSRRWNEE